MLGDRAGVIGAGLMAWQAEHKTDTRAEGRRQEL
jgi:hypothetical protein